MSIKHSFSSIHHLVHSSIHSFCQLANLQSPEGVILHSGDLVPGEVQDPEVLQTPEHVRGDQVDEVAIKRQLQQLALAEKRPRLQRRDAIILKIEIMEAAQSSQVLKTDLHYGVVLEEDGLKARRTKLSEWSQ